MLYDIDFELSAFVFMLVFYFSLKAQYPKEVKEIHHYSNAMLIYIAVTALDIISAITISYAASIPHWLNMAVNTIYAMSVVLFFYAFERYICKYLLQERMNWEKVVSNIVCMVYGILLILNCFTHWIFYFDESHRYIHGPAYFLIFFVPLYFIVTIGMILVIRNKNFDRRQKISIWLFTLLGVIGPLVQIYVTPNILFSMYTPALALLILLFLLVTPDYKRTLATMDELIRTKEIAEQAQVEAESATKAKSDFLANMSHEIRTPLNAICGMSELLNQMELPPESQEYAENIQVAADNLLDIVNDILDFSKIDAGKIELIEDEYMIETLIHQVEPMISSRLANKDVIFVIDIDRRVPRKLYGDILRVKQILLNLLGNAVKFTNFGKVALTIRSTLDETGEFHLIMEVADTGIGIREEDQEKLFSEFTQVDTRKNRRLQGTGLGLAISDHLARLMGGDIKLESQYGSGTTFTVSIVQKVIDPQPCGKLDQNKRYRIFLYEKNSFYQANILKMLRDFQITYRPVYNLRDLAHLETDKDGENYILYDLKTAHSSVEMNLSQLKEQGVVPVAMLDTRDAWKENTDPYIRKLRKPLHAISFARLLGGKDEVKIREKSGKRKQIYPSKRALIVDDNLINLKVIQGFLKDYQIQVTKASSGYEALDYMKSAEEFDIVFMDHMMPVMDGVETTEKIRNLDVPNAKDIPIVALTANAISGVKETFLQAGMNDFLAKPIDTKLLDEILDRWLPDDGEDAPEMELSGILENTEQQQDSFTTTKTEDKPVQKSTGVPGMDMDAALEYFGGSQEVLDSVLEVFCEESHERVNELERLLNERDYENYIVEAHGLKGAAKSIMADTLSEHAKEHEFAGKEGRFEWIDDHGKELVNEYRDFIASLEKYMQGEDDGAAVTEAQEKAEEKVFSAIDVLQTDGERNGTMIVKIEEFRLMYQYLAQLVKRNQQTLHILTLEISGVSEERREEAMKALERAICSALRESDVCSRYGDNKYFVLLLGAQEENGAFIAGRVLGAFDNLFSESGCVLDYHIQQVNK